MGPIEGERNGWRLFYPRGCFVQGDVLSKGMFYPKEMLTRSVFFLRVLFWSFD